MKRIASTWSRPSAQGQAPRPRCSHASCVVDHQLVVCGGWSSGSRFLDDVHIYSIGTQHFSYPFSHFSSPLDRETKKKLERLKAHHPAPKRTIRRAEHNSLQAENNSPRRYYLFTFPLWQTASFLDFPGISTTTPTATLEFLRKGLLHFITNNFTHTFPFKNDKLTSKFASFPPSTLDYVAALHELLQLMKMPSFASIALPHHLPSLSHHRTQHLDSTKAYWRRPSQSRTLNDTRR